jgi:hypothetical protein
MSSQQQYWDTFATLKRDAAYINRYHSHVEGIDRSISMISAITSSASIAGWAIWQQLYYLWAVVIAGSQVLIAVKAYLPYKGRLQALAALGPELDLLALEAEDGWFKVSRGLLSEQEIHARTMDMKRKSQKAAASAFKGMSLPDNSKLLTMADGEASAYMTSIAGDES